MLIIKKYVETSRGVTARGSAPCGAVLELLTRSKSSSTAKRLEPFAAKPDTKQKKRTPGLRHSFGTFLV